MRRMRSLALPVALLASSVVPVRADGPAPDRAPAPRKAAPDLPAPGGAGPRVLLTTRVIDVPPDVAARWRDPTRPAWRVLTDAEGARLLLRQGENVASTASTEVLLDQRTTHQILQQTSYIADYEIEVSKEGRIANPIVKTVVVGTHLEVVPRSAGEAWRLAVDVDHKWLPPIRAERVRIDGGPEATIQLPEVAGSTWAGDVFVPRGGHLLLLGADGFPGEGGRARLILVTPSAVPEGTGGR